MTVLVTGANGFVGAALVRQLLAEGVATRAFVRPASDRRNLVGLDVEVVEGDILRTETLRPALRGCDGVYHVAADYRLWVPDPGEMLQTNVQGSLNVLKEAADAGVQRMVYTSSVATLGIRKDRQPATETTPVGLADMIGTYKRSKYFAEQAVASRAAKIDFDVVTVNPSTPIGPGDIKPTPTGRIIVDAASGRIPAFVNTGLNLVHVDDVAQGHVLAMKHGKRGQRYILGGENMSLHEILGLIAGKRGRRAPRICLPYWSVLPVAMASEWYAKVFRREPGITVDSVRMAAKHMYFSSLKAEQELGYRSRSPENAIDDALAWFEENHLL